MTARHASWAAALTWALVVLTPLGEAAARDAADHVDRAAACRRRQKVDCVLTEAEAALAKLGPDGAANLVREARILRAEALALLDRPTEARIAFAEALRSWAEWRPPSDADPRVKDAAAAARVDVIRAGLPTELSAGRPPLEPPTVAELAPEPSLYAPRALVELDVDKARRRLFHLSIGAGAAFIDPEAAERFEIGAATALDMAVALGDGWALWFQVALSLHGFDDTFRVEPGLGRGLTTLVVAVGARWTLNLVDALDLLLAAGVGGGTFGVRALTEAAGPALQGSFGLRYRLHDRLGLRLDALPTLVIPIDADEVGPGGHIGVLLRTEIHF